MRDILVKFMKIIGDSVGEFSVHMYVIFVFLFLYLFKEGYWKKDIFIALYQSFRVNLNRVFILFILAITLVFFVDKPIKDYFVIHEYDLIYDLIFKFGKDMGDSAILFGILVIITIVGLIWKKDRLVHIISVALMSSAFASLIVLLFKVLITRERPDADISQFNFFSYLVAFEMGELFQYKFLSMPSGHTITIFSAMTPLFLALKNRWAKSIIVFFAVIVGFSRVAGMQHWVSDTIVGACFGIWVGVVFYNSLVGKRSNNNFETSIKSR